MFKLFTKKIGKVLVMPPDIYFGSYGDQAMLISFFDYIEKHYLTDIDLLIVSNDDTSNDLNQRYGCHKTAKLINPSQNLEYDFSKLIKNYSKFFICGADVLDGSYGLETSLRFFKLAKIANENNVEVNFLGFSFNEALDDSIRKSIVDVSFFSRLCVRDQKSFQRLKDLSCSNLILASDLSFLFNEKKYNNSIYGEHVIKQVKKRKNELLIGLHVTSQINEDVETFVNKIISGLSQLEKRYCVVLLPHDIRNNTICKFTDFEIANLLISRFKINKINYIDGSLLQSEVDVRNVVKFLDIVITSRMHLALASFAKNVPPISFSYQGKFEGVYDFYGFTNQLLLNKNEFTSDDLKTAIEYCCKSNIKRLIKEKTKAMKKMAIKNFSNF